MQIVESNKRYGDLHHGSGDIFESLTSLRIRPAHQSLAECWIGRAALDVFGQQAEQPFPLTAGDEILFEPVSQDAFDEAWAKVEAGQMAALSEVLA